MKKITKWLRNIFNHKVLFCDLDGTIIVTKSGKTFPESEEDWEFKKGIRTAIVKYNPRYIFIVSNQGGIEKGFVNEKKFVDEKMSSIVNEIESWGDFIVGFNYCKSNDPTNPYRKPNDGMVHDFLLNQKLKKGNALMIGDASGKDGQFSNSDLQCAKNAGIKYCDVDDFIRAADPCFYCSMRNDCYYYYECEEQNPFYSTRLNNVIIKPYDNETQD